MKTVWKILIIVSWINFNIGYAQSSSKPIHIPAMRLYHHDNIDKMQLSIAALDGTADKQFNVGKDNTSNQIVSKALFGTIDQLQIEIEKDSTSTDNEKYTWLRGLYDLLAEFSTNYTFAKIEGSKLYFYIKAFQQAMPLVRKNQSILPIVQQNDIEIGEALIKNFAINNNKGIQDSKDAILLKKCYRYPDKVMELIAQNPNAYFVDSIIVAQAFKDPETMYNYAAAPTPLGMKIHASSHPLVNLISLLSLIKTGRMYFPFLDRLYRGTLSLDSVGRAIENPTAYFKLLVATQIDYSTRLKAKDTPLIMSTLTSKLQSKIRELYINEINGLHDTADNVRFRVLEPLSSEELYYIAVMAEDEIYTSSYLGVYKRMFEKMKTPNADTLLNLVNYNYYKKFLKIAANYNTLDDFLSKMHSDNVATIMQGFVSNLENTNTLEDAVDVANSYGSIYDNKIKKLILDQIELNKNTALSRYNRNAFVIYNLLYTLFKVSDSVFVNEITEKTNINAAYQMLPEQLQNDSGRIVIQQFFYGDKDGQKIFNSFFNNFSPKYWKKTNKENWVELESIQGRPITIYSNQPFDNETDMDAKAQKALIHYLWEQGTPPSIIIHRGHSYFVDATIDQIPSSTKLVVLGSCGGYQRLNDVLKKNNDIQIIASKQTGTGLINIALITTIAEQLRAGNALEWKTIWKILEPKFKGTSKEKFDDYVPPYKNLGALFMTAYAQMMSQEGKETVQTKEN